MKWEKRPCLSFGLALLIINLPSDENQLSLTKISQAEQYFAENNSIEYDKIKAQERALKKQLPIALDEASIWFDVEFYPKLYIYRLKIATDNPNFASAVDGMKVLGISIDEFYKITNIEFVCSQKTIFNELENGVQLKYIYYDKNMALMFEYYIDVFDCYG